MKPFEPVIGSIKIGVERKPNFVIICKQCGKELKMKYKSITNLVASCECGYEEEINLVGGTNV